MKDHEYYDTGSDQPYCGQCGQHYLEHVMKPPAATKDIPVEDFMEGVERFEKLKLGGLRSLSMPLPAPTPKPKYPAEAIVGMGGGPTRATSLPEDGKERKKYPLATGLFDYFPDALVAVAHLSWKANEQHNPGEPVHWARGKSTDHDDTMLRHFAQRGTIDTDNIRHRTKVAWRALAALQEELEEAMAQEREAA